MELSAVTMDKVEDWLETIPSKHTRKNYVNGIKKFEARYGHSITTVRFQIVAYDYAGNNAPLNGTQPYCVYRVAPEFSSFLILALFMTATLLAIIVCKKCHPST